MKVKNSQTLRLNRETLRSLSLNQLSQAQGGARPETQATVCGACTTTNVTSCPTQSHG
jgi:hypothetical protein